MKLWIFWPYEEDDSWGTYEVYDREPTYRGGGFEGTPGSFLVYLCPVVAEQVFPKLRRDRTEFLEINIQQLNAWGIE